MDYNKLSTEELTAKLSELNEEFEQYKLIWAESYENMNKLSEEYNKINEIIKSRNE